MGESELAYIFFENIKRQSSQEIIEDNYYSYKSFLRNLSCFTNSKNNQLEEKVDSAYKKWKDDNNL